MKATNRNAGRNTSLGSMQKADVPAPSEFNGPFGHADRTLGATILLTTRVTSLAQKLVAYYGPPFDESGAVAGPGSVLGTLDESCNLIDDAINRANAALDAIESALP